MDDPIRKLVESATEGDALAVDALLEHHLPGLRAFIRLRAGERFRARESCSDLVQTVCREVLQHLDRFQYDGETGFKQWLYTTALRKIMDRHRFWGRDKRDIGRDVDPGPGQTTGADARLLDAYATVHTPSQDAMLKEEMERLEQAFDQLPDDYREVITLHRLVGLTHKEIAAQLDRSEEAVRKTLSRGMARLSRLLRASEQGGR